MRHALGRVAAPAADAPGEAPARAANEDAGQARRTRYARLARLSIRHTFYNASGGECRDFTVRPTEATAALLRSLGMLFKPAPDGFSVLYDTLQEARLLSYLTARRDERQVPGAWTRLSFLLSLRNPFFVNFSDLPIDINPARVNFYLSNRVAHRRLGGMVLLAPGTRVRARELVPVTAGQLALPVTDGVKEVCVLAISGEEVMCVPRCRPVNPDEPDGEVRCTDRLFLDFDTLPEDLYTVQAVDSGGAEAEVGRWLYTSLYPMPLCFVDLLFSDPDGAKPDAGLDGEKPGVYPVTLPPRGQTEGGWVVPGGVDYTLRFTRRSTWWSYYVMPQDPRGELYDLRIEHLREPGLEKVPEVRFLGPCKVRLSGGERAWRFLSECPLPLEQRSRLHLRLHGRTGRMTHSDVLMDRLPLASPRQVLPLGYAAARLQAKGSLVNPDNPGARCQRLLDRLRDPGPCSRGRAGAGARAPPADFSDIYVHV